MKKEEMKEISERELAEIEKNNCASLRNGHNHIIRC